MTQLLALLAAVGCAVGFLVLLWRPQWTVVLVVAMYPLEQLLQSYFPVFKETKWLINVAVGVLALVAVLSRVAKGERVLSGTVNIVAFSCLLLYGLAWLGLMWTPSYERATELMSGSLPRAMLFLVVLPLLVHDLRDFNRIAIGLLLVGSIIAIMIMANPISSWRGGRLSLELGWTAHKSGRSNPGALASLGGMMAVTAVLIRFSTVTPVLNLLRAVGFIAGMGLAIAAGSRGQVVFAAVLCVAMYPFARRVANPKQFVLTALGFMIVGLGVVAVFVAFVGDVNEGRWDVGKMFEASGGRLEMVVSLLRIFVEEPASWLMGLGTNAFTTVTGYNIPYVHNILAETLCEFGIFGFSVFMFALIGCLVAGRRLWSTYADDPTMRSLAAVLLAQVLYAFIMLLKQSSFYVTPGVLLWFVVLAAIAAHERRNPVEVFETEEHDDDELAFAPEAAATPGYGDYGDGYVLDG